MSWPDPGGDAKPITSADWAKLLMLLFLIALAWPWAVESIIAHVDRRQEAVAYIAEAKEVHLSWIKALLSCQVNCEQMEERAGSLRHHKEWVRRYDVVLEVLDGRTIPGYED